MFINVDICTHKNKYTELVDSVNATQLTLIQYIYIKKIWRWAEKEGRQNIHIWWRDKAITAEKNRVNKYTHCHCSLIERSWSYEPI